MQDAQMQSAIQAAFLSYSVVEKWLRDAGKAEIPMSIGSLFQTPEVKRAVRDKQHVKDIVTAFMSRGMLVKRDLDPNQAKVDKRETVGYIWNPEHVGEGYRPPPRSIHKAIAQLPSKPIIMRPEEVGETREERGQILQNSTKAVELIFKGVTLTISRNEESGNTRIVIEG